MISTMNKPQLKAAISKSNKGKKQNSIKKVTKTIKKTAKATDTTNKSMKIYTIVNQALHKKIKSLALKQGISISKFIHTALQAYMK